MVLESSRPRSRRQQWLGRHETCNHPPLRLQRGTGVGAGADLCHNWMRASLERLLKCLTVDDLTQLTVKMENLPGNDDMKEG